VLGQDRAPGGTSFARDLRGGAPPGKTEKWLLFPARCPYAIDVRQTEAPAWQEIAPAHFVGCHRAHELELAGVE
jgi:peptide/nickel transport system ATP-binding protein